MMTISDVQQWLTNLTKRGYSCYTEVGIDDGGLSLTTEDGEAYLEVGGIPYRDSAGLAMHIADMDLQGSPMSDDAIREAVRAQDASGDRAQQVSITAVGLAETLFTHKLYGGWYDNVSDELGGFPCIWALVVELAELLESTANRIGGWSDYEYLDIVEAAAVRLVESGSADLPTVADLFDKHKTNQQEKE